MQHDHPIEWIWLVFTLIDTWVSLSSYRAARRDRVRSARIWATLTPAERVEKAASHAVTYAIMVTSFGNFVFAAMLCACAITSLFLPPPPPSYLTVKQSLFVIGMLIVATIVNTFLSTYGRLTRWRLSTGYFKRQEQHEQAGRPSGAAIAKAYEDIGASNGESSP